jgi:hypothetical protein
MFSHILLVSNEKKEEQNPKIQSDITEIIDTLVKRIEG